MKYWGVESLTKLGSILGILLKTDHYTMKKTLLQYARLLIEMPLDSMFLEYIEFINDNEVLVRQQVHYEWKPIMCTHCQMLGHDILICKKKGVIRQEWRPEGNANELPKEDSGPIIEPYSKKRCSKSYCCTSLGRQKTRKTNQLLPGLLETKIKEKNINSIAVRTMPGWNWIHNFSHNPKGRIWIAWKPNIYNVELMSLTERMIHCYVIQLHSSKKFYISFIYGVNHESQRHVLWQDLTVITAHMNSVWCILGDFNSVLYKEDRIGGEEIKDHKIKEFAACIETCELTEMQSTRACYSWTNKTTWSRIDRVFINPYWPLLADFTQAAYLSNSLSEHTPIPIQFHDAPKPKSIF
ncbi:hypothetical protein Cgig2_011170 [Carnegiea gigantea]|uniref:Endonuclease/exonuclease/phosphatase domain-containing protein n=1 Tax=Carnegiea gigantea TaxID=171969 RepID=A0A9Q1JEG7_9CARY|nr:hypothetical protein Cgig2_011170 [Carnegiea gigantea]